MGARSAGNPHAACDVEGAGNVARSGYLGQLARQSSTLPGKACSSSRRLRSSRPPRAAEVKSGRRPGLEPRASGASMAKPHLLTAASTVAYAFPPLLKSVSVHLPRRFGVGKLFDCPGD
jgi:hypothetical protein